MSFKKTISLFIAACTLFFATNVLRGGEKTIGQVVPGHMLLIQSQDIAGNRPAMLVKSNAATAVQASTTGVGTSGKIIGLITTNEDLEISPITEGQPLNFQTLKANFDGSKETHKFDTLFGAGGSPAAPGYPTPPYPVLPPPPPGAKTPSPPAGPGYSAPPLPPPPVYPNSPAAITYGAPPSPPPPVYSSASSPQAPSAPEPYRPDREKKSKRASSDDDEESKPSATTVPAHGHFLSMKLKSLERTFYLTSSDKYPERKSSISQKTNHDGLTVLTVPKTHNTLRSVPVWISPDKTLRHYLEIAPGETIELDEVIELLSNATNGFRDVVREQPSQRPTVRSYYRATEPNPGRTSIARAFPRTNHSQYQATPRTETYRYERQTAGPSTYLGYPSAKRSEYYPASAFSERTTVRRETHSRTPAPGTQAGAPYSEEEYEQY